MQSLLYFGNIRVFLFIKYIVYAGEKLFAAQDNLSYEAQRMYCIHHLCPSKL